MILIKLLFCINMSLINENCLFERIVNVVICLLIFLRNKLINIDTDIKVIWLKLHKLLMKFYFINKDCYFDYRNTSVNLLTKKKMLHFVTEYFLPGSKVICTRITRNAPYSSLPSCKEIWAQFTAGTHLNIKTKWSAGVEIEIKAERGSLRT